MMLFRMAALTIAAICLSGAAHADDCAPAMAALRAGVIKPYSTTVTMTGMKGVPDRVTHVVMTGTKMYMQIGPRWTTIAMTSAKLLATMDDEQKTAKTTCRRTPDESVSGQEAAVYAVHTVNHGLASDSTVWISKTSGLPAKSEIRIAGGQTITSLFDYVHAQPPPGVK